MSIQHASAFVLFAIVAAISPGPSNVILTAIGARRGVVGGLACLFGVTLGMGLMIFLVAFGLGNLLLRSTVLYEVLRWVGIAVLLWLAWKIATAGPLHASDNQHDIGFWQAAAFQWVNPKSWLVCASAIGTFLQPQGASIFLQSLIFGILFILAAVPSCFVWLAFGAAVQRTLRTPRTQRTFNIAMGAILVGSILLFMV